MVHDKIDDHIDSTLMASIYKCRKIIHCSILRINRFIIRHIIFMIRRGRHDRHQPDTIASQIRVRLRITVIYIIEIFRQSFQITDSIPVTVIKAVNKHFIISTVIVIDHIFFRRINLLHQRQCSNFISFAFCICLRPTLRHCLCIIHSTYGSTGAISTSGCLYQHHSC